MIAGDRSDGSEVKRAALSVGMKLKTHQYNRLLSIDRLGCFNRKPISEKVTVGREVVSFEWHRHARRGLEARSLMAVKARASWPVEIREGYRGANGVPEGALGRRNCRASFPWWLRRCQNETRTRSPFRACKRVWGIRERLSLPGRRQMEPCNPSFINLHQSTPLANIIIAY